MARFTNYATLTYSGGTTDSNTVTGELLETLSMTKTALPERYRPGDRVSFVVSMVNSGNLPLTNLTLTDQLGSYSLGSATLYPLAYEENSLRLFSNGVAQTPPTVASTAPLTITGITVPAGGNVQLIYQATVTAFAPLGTEATVTNQVTATGGISNPVTASATIGNASAVDLQVTKALSPTAVAENGQITYTFVIANRGSIPAGTADQAVLTDTFNPRLTNLTVTYNTAAWTAGVNYSYDAATGLFTTLPGQITVPAATYTQNTDGTWSTTPGTATVTITGTI